VLVPGGFRERGIEGKIMAAKLPGKTTYHFLVLPWDIDCCD
jgi:CTP synthase (UTP-ammonia lyase)